jgi:hypothetical protein
MRIMLRRAIASTVFLAFAHPGSVVARDDGPGWYFGAGVGGSNWSGDIPGQIERAYDGYAQAEFVSARLTDDSDTAAQAIVGYRFSPWFGIEFGWQDLGEAHNFYSVHATGVAFTPGTSAIDGRYRARDINAAAVVTWPVAERFELLARGGVANVRLRYDETGHATNGQPYEFHASDNHTGALFGVGVNWRFAPSWSLRFAVDRIFDVGNRFDLNPDSNGRFDHLDAWTVNLFWEP